MRDDIGALPWLAPGAPFPDTAKALDEPDGLLAVGADLHPSTLLRAYRAGIFPWYGEGQPLLWWSPDPRLVLRPSRFYCSRSLRKLLRQGRFAFSIDEAFAQVLEACASVPRHGQHGTWITDEMQAAYGRLHELGHAHSLEVWQDGELAGGFYGINLGTMFFGESMFSIQPNASKAALAVFCLLQPAHGITMIDCQMETPHLLSLGAEVLPRPMFEQALRERVDQPVQWQWGHKMTPLAEYRRRYRLEATSLGQFLFSPG